MVHDGQHSVELVQISLCEVEDVEIVLDFLLIDERQHGVTPKEIGLKLALVVDLQLV